MPVTKVSVLGRGDCIIDVDLHWRFRGEWVSYMYESTFVITEASCLDSLSTTKEDFFYIDEEGMEDLPVFCSLVNGGGWMVVQRHADFALQFNRQWSAYETGFGSCIDNMNNKDIWLSDGCTSDLWLGNKYLRSGCELEEGPYQLLIQLKRGIHGAHAVYKRFWVKSRDEKYKLYVQGYTGTAGDSLKVHHEMHFTTKDNDNDEDPSQNCASSGRGGWWYNACGDSQLNGNGVSKMTWITWSGTGTPLTAASMMIKPNKGKVVPYILA